MRFGRAAQAHPSPAAGVIQRLSAGETQMDIARSFNVHHTTIGRLTTTNPFERVVVGQ
jgi:hypothetical protein